MIVVVDVFFDHFSGVPGVADWLAVAGFNLEPPVPTFHRGVVVAISESTHAALNAVLGK